MQAARRLYVYYRVDSADVAAAADAVRRLQAALRADWPGLQADLARRPELRDGQATLMETYAHPALATDAALEAHIEHAAAEALAPWLRGARHAERFDAL